MTDVVVERDDGELSIVSGADHTTLTDQLARIDLLSAPERRDLLAVLERVDVLSAPERTDVVSIPDRADIIVETAGPIGVRDGSDAFFEFDQGTPASVWNIRHNLGKFPAVSVVDSANNEVSGAVQYVDSNNIILVFNAAFSGKAFLN